MPGQFLATLLFERPWWVDMDRIAAAVRRRFPTIGAVDVVAGSAAGDGGVLSIDHCPVVLQSADRPLAHDAYLPPLKILRTWNPMPAIRRHRAQLTISCGGDLPGLQGALACAAATHFVTTAVVGLARPLAVLWQPASAVIDPGEFAIAAEQLLAGSAPLMCWVSYAPIAAEGHAPAEATGMVTCGLRPFLGHEVELAPRPGDPRSAFGSVAPIVDRALRGRIELQDGLRLADGETAMTVHERPRRSRGEESARVLVSDDSVTNAWELRPTVVPAA